MIDIDFAPDDRVKVYNHIFEKFGKQYASYILSLGTVDKRGCIEMIGRGLLDADGNRVYSLKDIDKIKEDFSKDEEKARNKYQRLFYYFDGLVGCYISQSRHPAGIVVSPLLIADYIGTVTDLEDDAVITQLDMNDIHELNFVKYDVLGLKNVGIIRDACQLAGIPYPKAHEVNWNDQRVFEDMITSPVGIFQFESAYGMDSLKKFKPVCVDDMSLVNGAIRPGGASYRDKLFSHEENTNPSKIIDDLLKNSHGFLVYQEQVIAFLQNICGFEGGEADIIRRAIGKKDAEKIASYLPKILDGYCSKSDKPREEAETEAKTFLKIIEDSSSYQFGFNHSTAYSMIGYLCAYLRYYYPYEFITAFLNNAQNDDDIVNGSSLAKKKGIKIISPKFRYSKDEYFFDKNTSSIAKGITSLKGFGSGIGSQLYELGKNNYKSFVQLLYDLQEKTSINKSQISILIQLGFFSEFGPTANLLKIYDYFQNYAHLSVIKKSKVDNDTIASIIKRKSSETAAQYRVNDMREIMKEIEEWAMIQIYDPISMQNLIALQQEYLGYIDVSSGKPEDNRKLIILDLKPLISKEKRVWAYKIITSSLGSGKQSELQIYKKTFDFNPISKYDVIYINEKNIVKRDNGKYVNYILTGYRKEKCYEN